ncbi:hypothetical protein COCNU_03G005830 [Cocos nucifera]|uniref:Uncharacterized protein n=1 Tax=Cocos nucifera TaxID=13894 RepID=A0A8K0I2X6_COCNU|nr:hypothetical protein COCNU_03G005830 [Cocos nucifera]
MDIDAVERLTKGLYTQKQRKGKASSKSSKWVKVGASDPVAPAAADVAPEVRPRAKVAPTASINVAKGGSLLPEPVDLPIGDHTSNPSTDKKKKEKERSPSNCPPQEGESPGGGGTEDPGGSSSRDWLHSGKDRRSRVLHEGEDSESCESPRHTLKRGAHLNRTEGHSGTRGEEKKKGRGEGRQAGGSRGEVSFEGSSPGHGEVQGLLRNERSEHRLWPKGIHHGLRTLRRQGGPEIFQARPELFG